MLQNHWSRSCRPKAPELRKLIGKHVEFARTGWVTTDIGVIVSVSGLNVEIEVNGARDWFWFGATGFSFASLRPAPEHDH